MNEWEAKYKALLMGIHDKEQIENAELIVSKAIEMSHSTGLPLEQTVNAMLHVLGIFRANSIQESMRRIEL